MTPHYIEVHEDWTVQQVLDYVIARPPLLKDTHPIGHVKILGPGTIGQSALASDLFAAIAPDIDAVSYHYYGALSQRCSGDRTPQTALSKDWLDGIEWPYAPPAVDAGP